MSWALVSLPNLAFQPNKMKSSPQKGIVVSPLQGDDAATSSGILITFDHITIKVHAFVLT